MLLTHRATLIGSTAIILWGTLALFTQLTGGQIPPFQLLAMTFSIAFILMLLRWLKQGHVGLQYLNQPPQLWLLGIGAYFLFHLCYFIAAARAPVVEVSMLASLWPLLLVLFNALLPGERLYMRHLTGATIALTGCWVLLSKGGGSFSADYVIGYVSALCAALIWATFSACSRLFRQVTVDVTGWFCAGTALLALCCHLYWETTVWPQTLSHWAGIVGLGIGPMGFAFFAWDHGVKHGNLPLLAVCAFFTPLISALLLVLSGEAEANWHLAISCLMIVSGALLAGYHRNRVRNPEPTGATATSSI